VFDRFLSVFSLVSRIPVKVRFRFDASRIDFYLPLVGICPAALSLLTYTAALRLTGLELFSAAAALLAEYLCFNLFHLDGLADTADAFLGHFDREKRLAILKDSRVGVYGLFAGIAAPAVKFCLLYGLLKGGGAWGGWTRLAPAFAFPIGGRLGGALVPCMSRPAKLDGLGALAGGSRARRAFAGFSAALLI
jgi:adenosylcobinamide-GDP ribazoletransferase